MSFKHTTLADGKWFTLPLIEQLANIGSEVNRVVNAKSDKERYDNAVWRALELFDLTLSDPRWRKRLKEISRTRELFCYAAIGDPQYKTTLEDINRYFFQFAIAYAISKGK